MVHMSEKKIAISMNDSFTVDDLQGLQKEIIEAIQCYDYKNYGNSDGCPFYHLLNLLASTLPTFYQQKQMIEFTEMANDPVISKTAIVEWFASSKEFILKELANQ